MVENTSDGRIDTAIMFILLLAKVGKYYHLSLCKIQVLFFRLLVVLTQTSVELVNRVEVVSWFTGLVVVG